MRIKKLVFICLITFLMEALCGCENWDRVKIADEYDEHKIKKLATKYLKEKYDEEDVSYGKIARYDIVTGGIDATSFVGFGGFYIEANDYVVYMAFEADGTYLFSDNKQYEKISDAISEEIDGLCSVDYEVSLDNEGQLDTVTNDNMILKYTAGIDRTYHTYFDGNLDKFFSEEASLNRKHSIRIYMDTIQTDERETLTAIQQKTYRFQNIWTQITEFEEGQYAYYEQYFHDYEKAREYVLGTEGDYFTKATVLNDVIDITNWFELKDGIYVKSYSTEQKIAFTENAREAFKEYCIENKEPNDEEAFFPFINDEQGIVGEQALYIAIDREKIPDLQVYQLSVWGNLDANKTSKIANLDRVLGKDTFEVTRVSHFTVLAYEDEVSKSETNSSIETENESSMDAG